MSWFLIKENAPFLWCVAGGPLTVGGAIPPAEESRPTRQNPESLGKGRGGTDTVCVHAQDEAKSGRCVQGIETGLRRERASLSVDA